MLYAIILIAIFLCIFILILFCLRDFLSPADKRPTINRIVEKTSTSKILNIPPRRMWGWGGWGDSMYGYCGECSLQSCMIWYGNYICQEQVYKAAGGPFLLGTNEDVCFANLHMNYELYPPGNQQVTIDEMLAYVKKQIDANNPIIFGLYVNEPSGDPAYDHMCPVYGYKLGNSGKVETMYFSDTYQLRTIPMDCSIALPICHSGTACTGPVGNTPIQKCYVKRVDFSNPDQGAPYDVAIPNVIGQIDPNGTPASNAISALLGNYDPNNELFPIWLDMNSPFEPNWGIEDEIDAPPCPISCKAYIEGLTAGNKYSFLRFDNPKDLPAKGEFLASGGYTMRIDFVADYSTFMIEVQHDPLTYPFMSDGTYFFRCVRTTLPWKQNFPLGTDRCDHTKGVLPSKDNDHVMMNQLSQAQVNAQQILTLTSGTTLREINKFPEEWRRRIQSLHNGHKGTNKGPRGPASRKYNPKSKLYSALAKKEAKAKPKCTKGPPVDPKIVCSSENNIGSIHPTWEWTFPIDNWDGTKSLGCIPINLKPIASSSTAKNCVRFSVSSPSNPAFEDDGDTGIIGLDGRFYVEDFGDYTFYSFSPNEIGSDHSYTLMSQDGVTVSTLTPVANK